MPSKRPLIAAGLFACLAVSNPAAAQGQGGGASSGLFGGGQSLFGSSINAGFGNSGLGGNSNQLGGFGSNALTLNQQGGQQGSFVGRTSEDTSAIFEALNQSGNQFLNRFERAMNSRNRGRGVNQADNARPQIRVKLSLGFRPPPAPSLNLPAPTADRLNGLLAAQGFDAGVEIDGGVAVLSGAVESDGDRMMLERLARLEPGVTQVDNRLTVVADISELDVLPPPAPQD